MNRRPINWARFVALRLILLTLLAIATLFAVHNPPVQCFCSTHVAADQTGR